MRNTVCASCAYYNADHTDPSLEVERHRRRYQLVVVVCDFRPDRIVGKTWRRLFLAAHRLDETSRT